MTKKVTVIVEGREYVVEVGSLADRPITATVNQKSYRVEVPAVKPAASQPAAPAVPISTATKPASPTVAVAPGKAVTAPMPGDIVEVNVKPGDSVSAGDVVCVLEAMKMKNMIRTSQSGKVASLEVSPGMSVDYGAVLVTFE